MQEHIRTAQDEQRKLKVKRNKKQQSHIFAHAHNVRLGVELKEVLEHIRTAAAQAQGKEEKEQQTYICICTCTQGAAGLGVEGGA